MSRVTWCDVCLCTAFVLCTPTCVLWAYMYVKVLMGLHEIPLFLSGSGNSQLQGNNPALWLCCDTAHCPRRCAVVCVLYVYLCMYICVCLLPGINSVGCVPAGDSVKDDGCSRTSSAPLSVSAAAAAVEQGISARSCIHTHSRTTATAQSPASGWGWTHTNMPTNTSANNTETPVEKCFEFLICSVPCGVSLLLDWPKDCGMAHFKPNMAERIVSGNEARPHSWPWQVSLQVNLSLCWRG